MEASGSHRHTHCCSDVMPKCLSPEVTSPGPPAGEMASGRRLSLCPPHTAQELSDSPCCRRELPVRALAPPHWRIFPCLKGSWTLGLHPVLINPLSSLPAGEVPSPRALRGLLILRHLFIFPGSPCLELCCDPRPPSIRPVCYSCSYPARSYPARTCHGGWRSVREEH